MGRLLLDGWTSVNLPAIDPTGAALWPTRWPLPLLRERERELGAYDWASLYMGQPMPRGGAVFSAAATYYDPADLRARLAAHTARLVIACDPAATARTHADHSAIVVAAFHREGREAVMSVVDVWRGQVEVPDLVVKLLNVQHRWRAPVGVESVGGFRGVGQMLRRVNGGLRVVELRATTDKFTRAQPAAAAWARGAIQVPPSAPWLSAFVAEVASFTGTGDKHDDQVDALSFAWLMAGIAGHAEWRERQRAKLQIAALLHA
jgi:predicted phage terminase large subunit-like protein